MRDTHSVVLSCWFVIGLVGCAATSAYLTKHPDQADDAAIATAAINCVDHAVAGVILEDAAPVILANALACAANLFSGAALAATKDAIAVEVIGRQAKIIKTIRATQLARDAALNPYIGLAAPPTPASVTPAK